MEAHPAYAPSVLSLVSPQADAPARQAVRTLATVVEQMARMAEELDRFLTAVQHHCRDEHEF